MKAFSKHTLRGSSRRASWVANSTVTLTASDIETNVIPAGIGSLTYKWSSTNVNNSLVVTNANLTRVY